MKSNLKDGLKISSSRLFLTYFILKGGYYNEKARTL